MEKQLVARKSDIIVLISIAYQEVLIPIDGLTFSVVSGYGFVATGAV